MENAIPVNAIMLGRKGLECIGYLVGAWKGLGCVGYSVDASFATFIVEVVNYRRNLEDFRDWLIVTLGAALSNSIIYLYRPSSLFLQVDGCLIAMIKCLQPPMYT